MLAIAGLFIASYQAVAQAPAPIPNWTTGGPGTSSGQYAPNQYPQQPGYQQQAPAYQQPPAYGQQYGAPQYQQPPAYGQDYGQQAYAAPDEGNNPAYQPNRAMSPDQLEQLVAPIALYPDNLLSMILAASTYPAQISAADQWVHMQGGAPPAQIAEGANAQTSWDPSVKALTAFPQVLDELSQNLQWTTDLGNAYYNQPQDVMQTVQVMRSRAQSAGNLQSSPQEAVTEDQGNIEIAPPTPDTVYVPQYDPWAVYGQPVNPYPSFDWVGAIGSFLGGALVHWGPGVAMNAFAVTPFGWLGWGLDWLGHAIFFNHDVWCTHSYSVHDWGFAHGGARWWGPHGQMASFRERGGWGGRGGWEQHTFRSGLDRGGNGRVEPRGFAGGERTFGNRGGENAGHNYQGSGNTWGRGNYGQNGRGTGFGYGANNGAYGRNGGFGQQAYNHEPQATGRPQQPMNGARQFEGRTQGYGSSPYGGQQFASRAPSYGGYGREAYGSSGAYGRPTQNYGGRQNYGQAYGRYSQGYRAPTNGSEIRSYNYGGSNNYARNYSGGGFHISGGGHSNSYGSGSYKAPKSWGGGGSYKAPKAPHFSGGGGGHFGGGHSGGGHSGGGHSGGGHGGHHH